MKLLEQVVQASPSRRASWGLETEQKKSVDHFKGALTWYTSMLPPRGCQNKMPMEFILLKGVGVNSLNPQP